MGGSYGGYMTNWVIGHTGDFSAAITDRCVGNLVSMFGTFYRLATVTTPRTPARPSGQATPKNDKQAGNPPGGA